MTRAMSKRLASGHYEVSVGSRVIGEIVRNGPSYPSSPWEARSEGWVAETDTKREALASLVGHAIGRNGHTPAPAVEATVPLNNDHRDDYEYTPQQDQERFTYLAWEEVKDRLALTRGLVLDMMLRRDAYMTLDSTTERLLKSIASSLYAAHQSMRRLDGESE